MGPGRHFAPSSSSGNSTATNSTPLIGPGTVLASLATGSGPNAVASVPSTGLVYIANAWNNNVTVVSGTKVLTSVPVGATPETLTVDPVRSIVYVVNTNGSSVTVLNGTSVLGTVSVGLVPVFEVFDPFLGWDYVTNTGSDNVSVLNGTHLVATIAVGSEPFGLDFDSHNDCVYVANGGGSNLTIINGTHVTGQVLLPSYAFYATYDPVTDYLYAGGGSAVWVIHDDSEVATVVVSSFIDMAYSPRNGLLYAASTSPGNIVILNNTTVVKRLTTANATLGFVYDGADGLMHAMENNSSGLTNDLLALDGTTIVGNVTVVGAPDFAACDPRSGDLYLIDYFHSVLQVVSVALAESRISVSPPRPNWAAVAVGVPSVLTTTLWGVGAGGDSATIATQPTSGLGCAPFVRTTSLPWGGVTEFAACNATHAGNYSVWINTTDALGFTTWSRLNATAFAALLVPAPVASVQRNGTTTTTTWVSVNQTVELVASPSGGAPGYYPTWTISPALGCTLSGPHTATPSCLFATAGAPKITVSILDADGANVSSAPLILDVQGVLLASTPIANHTSADVGQAVQFAEVPIGGSGNYSGASWTVLPSPGCTIPIALEWSCAFARPGSYLVNVSVSDSDSQRVSSPTLRFVVASDPTTAAPRVNRTLVDAQESATFEPEISGGVGPYVVAWSDLPGLCAPASGLNESCPSLAAGNWSVQEQVVDAAGFRTGWSAPVLLAVHPDPVVAAPRASPSSATAGSLVEISASISGGLGPFSYVWQGLPGGCASDASVVNCSPRQAGTFNLSLTVVDATGFRNTSSATQLVVAAPSSTASPSLAWAWVSLGVAGVLAAAAVMFLLLRRRRQRGRLASEPEARDGTESELDETEP